MRTSGGGVVSWLWSTPLLVAINLHLASGEFCQSESTAWQCNTCGACGYSWACCRCACGCCEDYDYCCVSCTSYWYAWLLLTLFFLVCLCACLGCGSYGYRRYRQPLTPSYTVGTTPRYGMAPSSEAAKLNAQPSTYQPYSATATGHHDNRNPGTGMGYHGNQATPSELPPPYNPSQAPPPYSTH